MHKLALAALLASAALAQPALAGNYVFHYDWDSDNSQPGGPMSATLYLTTSDVQNALGGYDLLSATGTIDGDAVTGIVANPNTPDTFTYQGYIFDNIVYGSAPGIDGAGIVVTTASLTYNFGYSDGYFALSADGSTYIGSHGQTDYTTLFSSGEGSLAAVPEPASWAMMLAGFGLAGAAMRRRRVAVRFA